MIEGSAWVARNNDIWAPDLWGYVTIREVDDRIPRIDFGLEGELFTGTGINGEQLWLHYNWMPVIGQDAPKPGKPHMACFVWLTEALETCRSIDDVESLLRQVNRHGGAGQVTETLAPTIANEPMPVESWTELVEDWWGEIVANPPGSQFDDYFQRQTVDGGQYGIESLDPNVQAQIVALRGTGATVHVWGTLHHNVPDYNAAQIQVTWIEVQEPVEPPDVTVEPVAGWVGTIEQLIPGSQFKDYFERNDGQRYGIEGATDALREQIAGYQWTRAQVRVWGQLRTDVPAYEGRSIQVERIEAVSGAPVESRNLTPFATSSASSNLPTDHGGQYQSWMAMDGALETSWVEGAAGPGVGEWIQFDFPGTVEVHNINMDVGYDRDDDIFYANNRIKRVTLSFSTGEQIEMELADARGMQTIVLARAPIPLQTTFVRIIINEVYPGSRHDDTCLAEVEVWGTAK